jgi:hypothetical protein
MVKAKKSLKKSLTATLVKTKKNPKILSAASPDFKRESVLSGFVTDILSSLAPGFLSLRSVFFILVGTFLMCLIFIQFPSFSWLGVPWVLPTQYLGYGFILAIVFLVAGFKELPNPNPNVDLSRTVAYPLLAVVIATAFYLWSFRAHQSIGTYWSDQAVEIIDPINIVDFHAFKLILTIGYREPLYTYVAAFIYWLFPSWKAVFIQRVNGEVFSLACLWVYYRLGREVSGKRLVGVLLAAFAAVSKPLLLATIDTAHPLCNFFFMGLFLLVQIRLFKKPVLSRFLQWGFVLGFGLTTYSIIRPYIPLLAAVTFGWILWQGRGEKIKWSAVVALFFSVCSLFFFLDKIVYVFHGNIISVIWGGSFDLWLFWQVIFLAALVYGYRTSEGKNRLLCAWALGLVVTGFLTYPFAADPNTTLNIATNSLVPKDNAGVYLFNFFKTIGNQIYQVANEFFTSSQDREDMNVWPDPLFGYQEVVLVILGLVWAIARMSWVKTFFLVCIGVGMLPRLLTVDFEGCKLYSSVTPLFLLAALAMGQIVESFWNFSRKTHWLGVLWVAGLAVFLAWGAWATYQRVYEKWWWGETYEGILSRQIDKDLPTHRIYLIEPKSGWTFSESTMGVLQDGNPIYCYNGSSNEINISSNDVREDLEVMVCSNNEKVIERFKREFPSAQWMPLWYLNDKNGLKSIFGERVVIPASQITEKPGKVFYFHVMPKNAWLRKFYLDDYGMAKGMIMTEDQSPTLNPMPVVQNSHTISAEGEWDAPGDGRYLFSINTPSFIKLWVDGNKVLDSKPDGSILGNDQKQDKSVYLSKGLHAIHYVSSDQSRFADVTIQNKDMKFKKVLGSK